MEVRVAIADSQPAIAVPGASPQGEKREKEKIKRKYSLTRAIHLLANQRKLDGIELEMHQEAVKEVQDRGGAIGGLGVPSLMFEKRADLVAGTDTAGGHTVPTSTESLIPILRPRMRVESLGATVLSGLSGNLDFPKQDGASVAVWEGETDENAQSDATFKKLTMSPKRVGAFTKFSKQLLAQSSISVENFVRNDLEIAIALAVDAAAINGSGAGNQPTGLLNTTGIGSVAIGANGGAATRNQLVDLESAIAAENADEGVLAFLTTPGVRGALRKTKTDAGSGIFVWGEMANTLLGYNAQVSTQVPSNLTKGSGTNLHAMLFGDFSKLVLGNWAGLDIVIDPYTLATQAMVKVTVNSWWDIMVRYPKAFSAIKDIAV
jgi:HK97 family phage major capsid protein